MAMRKACEPALEAVTKELEGWCDCPGRKRKAEYGERYRSLA